MSRISVDFSHLASSAAFDILSYKDFHSGPPVVGCDKLEGFGNSGVSSSFVVVKKGCYFPPKVIVCHDNKCCSMVPVSAVQEG